MSPPRKRATRGASKTTKKVTRKAAIKKAPKAGVKKKAAPVRAKSTAAKKTKEKTEKKTAKKDAVKPRITATPTPPPRADAPHPQAAPATRLAKATRSQTKPTVAQPIESAEKKPGLGAKWSCFKCGVKFYDLNRPDPICPRCHADQREQPAKSAVVAPPPTIKRAAPPPISRLLDDEESAEVVYDEDNEAEGAAELDMGKLDEEVGYLDDSEFTEETDD